MKITAFIIIIIAAASLSPTARAKTAPATLSKERIDYAVEYDRCKSSLLGKVGDEMGEVEALQPWTSISSAHSVGWKNAWRGLRRACRGWRRATRT